MSTVSWPASIKTGPVDFGIEFDVQIAIMRNGRVDTYGLPGARWVATLTFEAELETMQRPKLEALVVSLKGGANRLSMHHHARPIPNGTLRGAPTIASNVAAGAESLPLTNCNGTLKAGDLIGVLGQLIMVLADATPSGGNMTVPTLPALRTAATSGTAVTWDKPSILWIPRSNVAGPFPYQQSRVRPGFSLALIEAY